MMNVISEVMNAPHSFSVREMLVQGWNTMRNYWTKAVLLLAANVGFVLVLLILAAIIGNGLWGFLTSLVIFVSQLAFSVIVVRFTVMAADAKTFTLKEVISVTPGQVLSFVGTMLLYGLIVFAGLLAFILPGLYFVFAYFFAPYLVADKGLSPLDALKASKDMTKGSIFDLYTYMIVSNSIPSLVILPTYELFGLLIAFGSVFAIAGGGKLIIGLMTLLAVVITFAIIVLLIAYMATYFFGLAHIYRKLSPRSQM